MSEPNTLPRHTDIVAASVNEHRVAIAVFEHAQRTGERITLGVVERYLDEFRSHEPSCECGLCAAASRVRASGVWVRRERVGRPGSRPPGGVRRVRAVDAPISDISEHRYPHP